MCAPVNYNYELTPISAQPTRGIANGPVLDVDRSGGVHNGRLYVAYTDSASSLPANANDTDIYLVWSDDHGATWTVQSGRGNVEGGVSTEFLPWVAVDQNTGSVNVAYYTTAGARTTPRSTCGWQAARMAAFHFRKPT